MAGRIRVLLVAVLLVAAGGVRRRAPPPSRRPAPPWPAPGSTPRSPPPRPETQPPHRTPSRRPPPPPPRTRARRWCSGATGWAPTASATGGRGHRRPDPALGTTGPRLGLDPGGKQPFGVCPGNEVRVVEWRGFSVLFSDGPTRSGPPAGATSSPGPTRSRTWTIRRPTRAATGPGSPPRTGVSVGATVADLQRAYGERLELFDEDAGPGPAFGVQTADGGLFGRLTSVEPGGHRPVHRGRRRVRE